MEKLPRNGEITIMIVDGIAVAWRPYKHGYWINLNDDGSAYKCSVCGEVSCCTGTYCPDCGSRMDGEEI